MPALRAAPDPTILSFDGDATMTLAVIAPRRPSSTLPGIEAP